MQLTELSTENAVGLEDLKRQLLQETTRLPHKCRMVFQLSRNEGFSQKQIAIKLNIAEKTVEAHLSKALRSLRTGMSHLLTTFY
jgi:RNA polymerase sigma-70 factor (ECF subfamily)